MARRLCQTFQAMQHKKPSEETREALHTTLESFEGSAVGADHSNGKA
jgi:hypothetical protein